MIAEPQPPFAPRAARGLRFKFVVSISLLLVLILGGAAIHFTKEQKSMLLLHLDRRASSIGQFVAMISPEAIYTFDITTLDRFVTQISQDPDIRFAQVRDQRGRVLTTFMPPDLSPQWVDQVISSPDETGGLQTLRFPISDQGDVLGELLVLVDYNPVLELIARNLRYQMITYLGIVIFLGGVIFTIFHYNVLRPVHDLIHGANRISQGEYEFELPVLSNDELGSLTRCFNHMSGEIRRERAELESTMALMAVEVAQRRLAEEQMRLAASVFTSAREGITITDTNGKIIDVNAGFTTITGYGHDEVIGQNPRLLRSGHHDRGFYQAMWDSLLQMGHWSGEIWNRHKSGETIVELLTISAVKDERGDVSHFVALYSDITEQKAYQKRLEHAAHFDVLTNLPNRVLLSDRLHQAMVQASRRGNHLALVYLDLDGFKQVNDRFGHDVGDQLLVTVAEQMTQALRESDTIGRLGGDEFAAILIDLERVEDCVPLLERLLEAAARPVELQGREVQVSASVGVSFFPQADPLDEGQLMRQADQAMYQAKLAGKNCYSLFDPARESVLRGQGEELQRLMRGLEVGELELYYQPKVNLRSGELVGAEALIRWRHPDRGLLYPAQFLPLLEGHPQGARLGEWVIDQALRQLEAWKGGNLDVPISVNIDAYHLQQPSFPERLRQILAEHPAVAPEQLVLELLETSTVKDIRQVSLIMRECVALGVGFALDDFGTGYSSLIYLKNLPARQLKIDQTFVRDMLDDPEDLAIVEGVLGLATGFQRDVIAEGMETGEHGRLLLQLGCEVAQGYGIARPMPAAEMPAWLASWQPDPGWRELEAVGRDQLPILFSVVVHRAWVQAIDDCINGKRSAPPPMDLHQCRFSHWLQAEGRADFGDSLDRLGIEPLHEELHDLGGAILALQEQGRNPEAAERLPALYGLRDRLLENIGAMLD